MSATTATERVRIIIGPAVILGPTEPDQPWITYVAQRPAAVHTSRGEAYTAARAAYLTKEKS